MEYTDNQRYCGEVDVQMSCSTYHVVGKLLLAPWLPPDYWIVRVTSATKMENSNHLAKIVAKSFRFYFFRYEASYFRQFLLEGHPSWLGLVDSIHKRSFFFSPTILGQPLIKEA